MVHLVGLHQILSSVFVVHDVCLDDRSSSSLTSGLTLRLVPSPFSQNVLITVRTDVFHLHRLPQHLALPPTATLRLFHQRPLHGRNWPLPPSLSLSAPSLLCWLGPSPFSQNVRTDTFHLHRFLNIQLSAPTATLHLHLLLQRPVHGGTGRFHLPCLFQRVRSLQCAAILRMELFIRSFMWLPTYLCVRACVREWLR